MSIVNQCNLVLEQVDMKITFLHGNLEDTLYMQQPKGFVEEEGKILLKMGSFDVPNPSEA